MRGIAAEFHKSAGGRLTLFALTVHDDKGRSQFDIEWCRRDGVYVFNYAGGGGRGSIPISGIYFASGDIAVKEKPTNLVSPNDKPPWRSKETRAIQARNKTRRLNRLPKAFDTRPSEDLLDWLNRCAIDSGAVFCATCRDHFADDYLCSHIWWCEKLCWWSTPQERCECESREKCEGRE